MVNELKIFLFFGLLTFNVGYAGVCTRVLGELSEHRIAGPAAPPVAPPEPKRAPVPMKPPPAPEPDRPQRRQVPIPAPPPHEPVRKIPEKPLEDPKDIQPEDLYSSDSKVRGFWNEMPIGLRRVMLEGVKEEKAKLEKHMVDKYGNANPETLMRAVVGLQTEIEGIESGHKKDVLEVISKMIAKRYGKSVDGLRIELSQNKPARTDDGNASQKSSGQMIPELPKLLDEGMVYRTEMRNLWQQGEGWIGMKEFAYLYAKELNAIHPGLAEKYQELDRLYRFGQLAQLGLIPVPEVIDHLPRETISAGREIVTTNFEIVKVPDGSESVQVKEVKGIAVGRNGWAAAHEARKAAAQMATPSEGAYRWMMPPERRNALNQATNSHRAEIRQGVFGPVVVRELTRRLALTYSDGKTPLLGDKQYHEVMDGVFSLHPGAFKRAMSLVFDSEFEKSESKRKELKDLLFENGVYHTRDDG